MDTTLIVDLLTLMANVIAILVLADVGPLILWQMLCKNFVADVIAT